MILGGLKTKSLLNFYKNYHEGITVWDKTKLFKACICYILISSFKVVSFVVHILDSRWRHTHIFQLHLDQIVNVTINLFCDLLSKENFRLWLIRRKSPQRPLRRRLWTKCCSNQE